MPLYSPSYYMEPEPYEDNSDPEIHVPSSLEREKCPVCGNSYVETLYYDMYDECFGCDLCVSKRDVE